MPTLGSVLYCEGISQMDTPGGTKQQINGLMVNMRPMFVPGLFSFSIVIPIKGLDLMRQHEVQIMFKCRETGEVSLDTGKNIIHATEAETDLPLEETGIVMNLDFRNVIINNEGYYDTEVYIDGEMIGKGPIYVKGAKHE